MTIVEYYYYYYCYYCYYYYYYVTQPDVVHACNIL